MLAAWHASMNIAHPIPNREFLLNAFDSLGSNRREALKLAAGFRGEEAVDRGVTEERALETVLEWLSPERQEELAVEAMELYLWDRAGQRQLAAERARVSARRQALGQRPPAGGRRMKALAVRRTDTVEASSRRRSHSSERIALLVVDVDGLRHQRCEPAPPVSGCERAESHRRRPGQPCCVESRSQQSTGRCGPECWIDARAPGTSSTAPSANGLRGRSALVPACRPCISRHHEPDEQCSAAQVGQQIESACRGRPWPAAGTASRGRLRESGSSRRPRPGPGRRRCGRCRSG